MNNFFDLLEEYSKKHDNAQDVLSLWSNLSEEETIKILGKSKGRKIVIYYEENTMDGVKYRYE